MKFKGLSWSFDKIVSRIRDAIHRLSWWRTSARKPFRIRAVVRPVLGGEFKAETHDISATGVYISLEKVEWDTDESRCRHNIQIGKRCMVRLMIDQFHVVHVNAEIVRTSRRTPTHPAGFALRFICLEAEEKRILGQLHEKFEMMKAA